MCSGNSGIGVWWTFYNKSFSFTLNNLCTVYIQGGLIGSDRISHGLTKTRLRYLDGVLVDSRGKALYGRFQLLKTFIMVLINFCLRVFHVF